MMHVPPLIEDLGLILAAAGIVTLLFKKFHQPIVLGYIIAGILVGPHFNLFPTIGDSENIKVWGEIGVLFLLFGLGLEFSFKKLARVGGAASITALIEVVVMGSLGYFVGKAFGWTTMDSLFLGGILSISSTTIIIRAFEELGIKGRGFVSLVFGVLIVEDLIAILLLVLLSTIALTQSFAGGDLLIAMVKLSFFLVLWFVLGIFILPTLLRRLQPLLTPETLLVVSLGLCFLMVMLTTRAGFSPALGAFMMGSVLAETREGKRIEHLIEPVKNLFAAIFFVSVGMLIDPQLLINYAGPIAIITIVTILGKVFSIGLGVLLSGRPLRHAIQCGLSVAQIGEFSFIIAGLGLSLKVTSDFLYPLAVGVSAVTTFTTPYLMKYADHLANFAEARLPKRAHETLENYSSSINSVSFASEWWTLARFYSTRLILNAVLVTAIFLAIGQFVLPRLQMEIENVVLANLVGLFIAGALSAPFFWAMVMGKKKSPASSQAAVVVFEVCRWLLTFFLVSILATQFFAFKWIAILFLSLGLISLFILSSQLETLYVKLEGIFVRNLAHETATLPHLAPWDAHLTSLEVTATSPLIGHTLEENRIRERFGISIALIERGGRKIPAPGRHEKIFPFDTLFVIGTDEQIIKFRQEVETLDTSTPDEELNYVLVPHLIVPNSHYIGRTIRDSGIREKSQGLIVGVERQGERTLNPDSTIVIKNGDLLWIVGERNALKHL